MPDFPIVDAHLHIYDPAAHSYPWMSDIPLLNRPHGKADYDRATEGLEIDKVVFVEVDVGEGLHLDEVRWVAKAAEADGRIQGMVASIPLEKGAAAVEADLVAFVAMPLARGVRRLIQGHVDEPGWCLRPDFIDALKLVGSHGLGFDICIYHPQMADAIELARRCPEVEFILDHIGKPGIKDGAREPWWSQMRGLAALPNVICKVSGVITEADHGNWTYDQVAPYVVHAIECFGFDRVAFGGDWPVVNLAASYKAWVGLLDRVVAGATETELRKLYRDNAIRYYRL